ncbi:hypothetical protein Tco_0024969 [Tanacetum coccineum]
MVQLGSELPEIGFYVDLGKWVPKEEFILERGVRQGDPLSPFLFILTAEGLNALVSEAVEKGVFKGVAVGANRVVEVSGLKVNYNKSKLFSIGVSVSDTEEMARWMSCSMGEFPFTYLGLPIGDRMSCIKAWRPVVEKFKNRLADWKARSMSFGGRLTLVKSVLGSLPLYYFSLFRVPSNVINNLEGIRRDFLWGDWALLGKWWWRFKREGDALWVRVIKSVYRENGGLSNSGDAGYGCGDSRVRRDIIKLGRDIDAKGIEYTSSFFYNVRNGRDVSFWLDRWIGDFRLCDWFPRLFHLDRRPEGRVAEKGRWVEGVWTWE